jgi:predicted GNAT superfamily acetyltransferase
MKIDLLSAQDPTFLRRLDDALALLRPHAQTTLFPHHFLSVTLPRIGGLLLLAYANDFAPPETPLGAGFLFPRRLGRQATGNDAVALKTWTLRWHGRPGAPSVAPAALLAALEPLVAPHRIVFYNPDEPMSYFATHHLLGPVEIGRPDAAEAARVPALQQRVWGSPPAALYPADLLSADFQPGTGLVARVGDELAGFLFGFYKFGGSPLPADWQTRFGGDFRLESQTMAVAPEHRGLRVANLLKKVQAEHAWREGIGVVNWTADPLQYPNAALNFGLLRAMAFDFYPDLYPFRNELNRVSASRFGLTWLVGTHRVQEIPPIGSRATVVDLTHHPYIEVVNDGFMLAKMDANAEVIAIEIPAEWTVLQQSDLQAAAAWRAVTDSLFARYIGRQPGQYVVTGVGVYGEKRFLLGERAGDGLWERLGAGIG